MSIALAAAILIPSVLALALWQRQLSLRREAHIRSFDLPQGLFDRLRKRHPGLSQKDCQLVANALRQFFLTHLKSGRRNVSMPSQVVDDLWHEFILYTKNYQAFCRRAFGRFLHHTPAVALGGARVANAGLRRCFWFACREEHINPKRPTRLPLLFAIDAKLSVPGGFRYVTDCSALRAQQGGAAGTAIYCGGDFADASVDGGTDGFGDFGGSSRSSSSEGGSSDGGGGGDSGCSGGGCGGGSE
jgi:hypothetical protein